MQRCPDDHAGIQVDRVLRLVGQVGLAVLELGNLGLRVGPADPLLI